MRYKIMISCMALLCGSLGSSLIAGNLTNNARRFLQVDVIEVHTSGNRVTGSTPRGTLNMKSGSTQAIPDSVELLLRIRNTGHKVRVRPNDDICIDANEAFQKC